MHTHFRSIRSIAAFAATLGACVAMTPIAIAQKAPPASASADALKALQGDWAISAVNGQSLADSGTEMWLTFTGDKYAQTVNGTVAERGTVKLDASKKPIAIDLVITEGNDAGKTQLGVIQLAGETLTFNLNTPGLAVRPADFSAQDGFVLFVATKRK